MSDNCEIFGSRTTEQLRSRITNYYHTHPFAFVQRLFLRRVRIDFFFLVKSSSSRTMKGEEKVSPNLRRNVEKASSATKKVVSSLPRRRSAQRGEVRRHFRPTAAVFTDYCEDILVTRLHTITTDTSLQLDNDS